MSILDITDRCNLKCTYCCRGVHEGKIVELANEHILDIARQIIKMRGTFFVLQGGEPSLKKNITPLLEELANLKRIRPGFYLEAVRSVISSKLSGQTLKLAYMKILIEQILPLYCITTNGMYYSSELEEALYTAGFSVEVSLDAPTATINKQNRIGINFEQVVDNIRKYTQRLPVEISCTITESNVQILPEMIPFAKESGCICLKLSPVIMIGDRDRPDSLWAEQYIDAVDRALDRYPDELAGLLLKVKLYPEYFKLEKGKRLHERLLGTNNVLLEVHECTACRQIKNIYIDPNMNVYPCASMKNEKELILGNLKEMSLKDIWESHQKREVETLVREYSAKKFKHDFSCTAVAYSQLKNEGI